MSHTQSGNTYNWCRENPYATNIGVTLATKRVIEAPSASAGTNIRGNLRSDKLVLQLWYAATARAVSNSSSLQIVAEMCVPNANLLPVGEVHLT
jgi:hypothetical protein